MDMGSDGDEADISGRSNRHDLTATQLRQGEWPDAAGKENGLMLLERAMNCLTGKLGG